MSFVFSVFIWLAFSWPLPNYVNQGIPSSARSPEAEKVRYMIPGDHLQLMYHFWLVEDMLKGQTKLFNNTYEFNTGDDSERFAPGSYYVPFSLIFAAIDLLSNRSFAWNLTGFLAVWLSFLFTWMLAERYSAHKAAAIIAAILAILMPVRWINLFGGSPAGFTIMWVPAILLGLDMAVRNDSPKGGFLAGIGLLFAGLADLHVFFFSALLTPAWCLIAFIKRGHFGWGYSRSYRRLTLSLLPAALLGGVAVAYRFIRQSAIEETTMSGGREWGEAALFSPSWQGLFSYSPLGISNHIFLGSGVVVTILVGFVAALAVSRRRRSAESWRHAFIIAVLLAGLTGITFLALGTNGPREGLFFRAARKLIPKYDMIRQPAKIYCMVPSMVAVLLGCALTCLCEWKRTWKAALVLLIVPAFWIAMECKIHVRPMISLVADNQEAYEELAHDAESYGRKPRALAIPLWPGDSAWSSLYEHYSSLYRIRMVNGYSPVVPVSYMENVFYPLESLNKGNLTQEHFEILSNMKVDYLVLHEDAFPEKVSPLPVAFTLKNLLAHQQLTLIDRSDSVWVFKINDPAPDNVIDPDWSVFFPARRWEFEWLPPSETNVRKDKAASKQEYLRLSVKNSVAQTKPVHMSPAPGLKWLLRARNQAEIKIEKIADENVCETAHVTLAAEQWEWFELPFKDIDKYSKVSLRLKLLSGMADVDLAMMISGSWDGLDNVDELVLPAPLFFHAGYTELEKNIVVLEPLKVPGNFRGFKKSLDIRGDTGVFYGPRLPLAAGKYEVSVVFDSPAAQGEELGGFYVRSGKPARACAGIVAGEPASLVFEQKYELPVSVNILYSGKDILLLKEVRFKRRDDEPAN